MARTVRDVALMLDAMLTADPTTYQSVGFGTNAFSNGVADTPREIRLGVPRLVLLRCSCGGRSCRWRARGDRQFRDWAPKSLTSHPTRGIRIGRVMGHRLRRGLWLSPGKISSTRSRDYTRSFLHKITGAALVTAEEYLAAQRIRERVTAEFLDAFTQHDLDALVTPADSYAAFGLGASPPQDMGRLTRPLSLAGLPSLASVWI